MRVGDSLGGIATCMRRRLIRRGDGQVPFGRRQYEALRQAPAGARNSLRQPYGAGCGDAWGDFRDLDRRRPAADRSGSMPSGVALTTRSKPKSARFSGFDNDRARNGAATVRRAPGRGRSACRTGATRAAPAAASADAIAAPAPPAPTTRQCEQATAKPVRSAARTKPMPSNRSPYRVPSARRTIALQAPAMRTASLQSSSRSTVAGLCGMVTNAPGTLRARNNPLSTCRSSPSERFRCGRPRRRQVWRRALRAVPLGCGKLRR